MALNTSSTASDPNDQVRTFRVTHPFHPLHGRVLQIVTVRNNWGEDRVFYHDTDRRLVSISSKWTTLWEADPVVMLSRGRSAFLVDDLLELRAYLDILGEGGLS